MTGREKQIVSIIKEVGKATPRYIGEMMSITSGYAEQLGNMMVRRKFLVKKGKYFIIPEETYYTEELKREKS